MKDCNQNKNLPLVSIITINYNNTKLTCDLINSIKKNKYINYEILVIDNASKKGNPLVIKEKYPEIKLFLSPKNLGFAGGNNLGIKHAKGDYIFLLNNDTEIVPNTIGMLIQKLKNDLKLGAVSPKIKYYSNPNMIQYAGSTQINHLTLRNKHIGNRQVDKGQHDFERDTNYAHGAAMMIPRKVVEIIGPMPESYFLYYEEIDWCEKIKNAGYRIRYIPSSVVYHKESMSIGKESVLKTYYITRNRFLYARRNIKGWKFLFSMLYMLFISIPKNTICNLQDLAKIKAYYSGLIWNLSNGKLLTKPFKS
jgi:GT2 family glycosyltransferase